MTEYQEKELKKLSLLYKLNDQELITRGEYKQLVELTIEEIEQWIKLKGIKIP